MTRTGAPTLDTAIVNRHRLSNALQTLALLAAMALLAAAVGWLLAGADGVLVALLSVVLAMVLNPALGPDTLLRLYGARRLAREQAPGLHRVLDELSARAGLEHRPALWYLPSGMVNAFALGSGRRAAITLSDGMLRLLAPREVAAVMAHEVCHLRTGDTRVMGLADLLTRLTHFLAMTGLFALLLQVPLALMGVPVAGGAGFGVMLLLVLSPTLSALLQLKLSRTREFDADLGAVSLTGDPRSLATALERIERVQRHPFEAVLLPGRRLPEPSLLRTHPPTEERVQRLLALAPPDRRTLDYLGATGQWRPGGTLPRPPRWRLSGLWH